MAFSPPRPQPLDHLPEPVAAAVRGVFTDIDDTLTTGGAITPDALAALQALADAGVPVIAITGRPLGWSEPFARDWPLAAIVAENGAVALFREGGRLCVEFAQDAATRARNAARLQAAAAHILQQVPDARLARDSAGRATDIAIDHAEFAHLSEQQVAQVLALMQAQGLQATVSSIHVNGWFGSHSKLSGARWMLQRLYGRVLEAEIAQWAYVGDSTNDQQMFERFPLGIGVANLMHFAARLRTWPAYLADGERGAGFAQVARRLLQAR